MTDSLYLADTDLRAELLDVIANTRTQEAYSPAYQSYRYCSTGSTTLGVVILDVEYATHLYPRGIRTLDV